MENRCPVPLHLVQAEGGDWPGSFFARGNGSFFGEHPPGIRALGWGSLGVEQPFFPLLPSPINIVRRAVSYGLPAAQVSCQLLSFGLTNCKLVASMDPLKFEEGAFLLNVWFILFVFCKEGVERREVGLEVGKFELCSHLLSISENTPSLCSCLRSWIAGSQLVLLWFGNAGKSMELWL